ncbi:uncharacterized protein IUM83_17569 [Phytophthora cinnamomi]|uniref:uncharacterized protein n=1 Tax=Phytophthora cinnamomi TaxID=4785 RepID=UPI00355A409E|nr:hypothetical protein IUM83_17569 [Phytophthora cinnamomi]
MTVYVSTSFHGISLLAPYALSLRNFHHLDESLWTVSQLVARFIAKTCGVYTLVHVLVTGGTYATVSIAHDLAAKLKLHLYLACLWNSLYRASVDEASRRVYQRETLEGVERGYVNNAPYWRRYVQAVGRSMNFTVVAMLAASLVHVCSALDMLDSSFASLKFSVASVVLKSVVLTITKRVALKRGGTHLRNIYVLTAVPTVLINTQVRLVLLQNAKSGSSVRSFLELGMLEHVIRITKVWHLKHSLKQAPRRGGKPVSTIRARVRRISATFPLPNSVAGHEVQTTRPSKLTSEGGGVGEWEETLLAGSWQVGIEIVVDFVCCVFELVNGIPLQDS